MNTFVLSEEQNRLKKEVREFVDSEIAPHMPEADASGEFPRRILGRIAELGYYSVPFPKELGGAGRSLIDGIIVMEELSRGSASIGFILTASVFQCCYALRSSVSDRQKRDWLMPAIAGQKLLTLALSETRGGSEALGIDTVAAKRSDGWLLNGSKCWITNAGVADGYIVGARTNSGSRSRSMSMFYVDAKTKGVSVPHLEDMIGLNNSPTGTVEFRDCLLPPEAIIGEENEGYKTLKTTLNCGRLAVSAVAIGMAQSAFEKSVAYSNVREGYDRPISSYQGVSFPIANMYMNIAVARNMLYHAAALVESGSRCTMEIAALKLFSTEMCQKTCQDAALIHGSQGYNRHSDTERLLRESQLLTVAEGTSQICRVAISNGLYNTPLSELEF